MKKVLITSGGTREYIDDVRVLTNISTGKLGAKIAEIFYHGDEDFEIHYVAPKSSERLDPTFNQKRFVGDKFGKQMFKIKENHFDYEVTDVQSVYDIMEKLVPEMDIVIHCMAVSDFGFKPCSTKLKSNDPIAFIESLKERIYQTPKILKQIKKWNPKCKLVSFKFEVGLEHEKLIEIATNSGKDNGCDLVIANDKTEMVKAGSHVAYAIHNDGKIETIDGKEKIAEYIFNFVKI